MKSYPSPCCSLCVTRTPTRPRPLEVTTRPRITAERLQDGKGNFRTNLQSDHQVGDKVGLT